MKYRVTVGNIGEVENTDDVDQADAVYEHYRDLSRRGVGKAAWEPVTLWVDDEPFREYPGGRCDGCARPYGALPPPHTFREGCALRSPLGERLDAARER